MKIKHKQPRIEPLELVDRLKSDALLCEWTSYTHNRCHKIADPASRFASFIALPYSAWLVEHPHQTRRRAPNSRLFGNTI